MIEMNFLEFVMVNTIILQINMLTKIKNSITKPSDSIMIIIVVNEGTCKCMKYQLKKFEKSFAMIRMMR